MTARLVTCGVCRKRVPFYLGGPIALPACPWCGAYFPETPPGAPLARDARSVVAAPHGVDAWYAPGDAFARRWRLVDQLHYGATAVVVRALPVEGYAPALLVMLRVDSPDAVMAVRGASEKIGTLEDAAVLPLREADADGSTPYLAYDLPEGKLLSGIPTSELSARPEVADGLLEKVVTALARLQASRMPSSDVTPWLIAVQPKGEPFLLGAGLGNRLTGMLPLSGPAAAVEEAWIAPELVLGQAPVPATDVHGAMMLWAWMRTGGPVTRQDLRGLRSMIGPLSALAPFERDLARAGLATDPARRIASPRALLDVLTARAVPADLLESPPAEPAATAPVGPQAPALTAAARDRTEWNDLDSMRGRVDEGARNQEIVLRHRERTERVRSGLERFFRIAAVAVVLVTAGAGLATLRPRAHRYPACPVTRVGELPGGGKLYRAGIDGAELVLVPGGPTLLGVKIEQAAAIRRTYEPGGVQIVERETPERTVDVKSFLMDRVEVSNARYKVFLDAITKSGDHSRCHPNEPRGIAHVPHVPARWATAYSWTGTDYPPGTADYPVVLVTWFDAYAYAAWAGLRLPTEAEWERGARGNDARSYPWGDTWEPERANVADRIAQRSLPMWPDWKSWVDGWKKLDESDRNKGTLMRVGAYPLGASPFGLLDMAGNVWEWTRDDYRDEPGAESWKLTDRVKLDTKKSVRGGSWCNFRADLRTTRRGGFAAGNAESYIGFRCARDPE